MTTATTMLAWTKMRAEENGFDLVEHQVPKPDAGEILVRTRSTSICGTDLHIWLWDDWSQKNVELGTITGHETSGEIIQLGDGVIGHQIGDHIAVECHISHGICERCEEGNSHVCEHGEIFGVHRHGAFAPYFTIPATNARKVSEELDEAFASIQDPLGNAVHTLSAGPVAGCDVAIHGLGPIGLFAVDVARAQGARKVIAVDWDNEMRMEIAAELGADLVLGHDDDVVEAILSATNGRGVDTSCEFSGSPTALANALRSTRLAGHVNVLAVYGMDPVIPINEVVFRYLTIKGINGRRMWETWDTMHDLFSNNALNVEKVVTHRLHWHDFQSAMALVRSGECGKVILDFDE